MSKFGKELVKAAREGVAIARGELDPKSYRVHRASDDNAVVPRVAKGDFRFSQPHAMPSIALKGMKAGTKPAVVVKRRSARPTTGPVKRAPTRKKR